MSSTPSSIACSRSSSMALLSLRMTMNPVLQNWYMTREKDPPADKSTLLTFAAVLVLLSVIASLLIDQKHWDEVIHDQSNSPVALPRMSLQTFPVQDHGALLLQLLVQ